MSKKKEPLVWRPAGFSLKKSYALQALAEGRADEAQQMEALKYIVQDLCGMRAAPEDLENDRTTYYNLGRQGVGRAINHIVNLNLKKIKEMQEETNHGPRATRTTEQ